MTRVAYWDEQGRVCRGCGAYKAWEEYHTAAEGFHGHLAICKPCRRQRNARYYAETVSSQRKCARKRWWAQRDEKLRAQHQRRVEQPDRYKGYGRTAMATRRRRIIGAMLPTILDLVAEDWGTHGYPLTADDLRGRGRGDGVDDARAVAYFLLRTHLKLDDVELGPLLGRDRTTIAHGLANLRKRRAQRPDLNERITALHAACIQARRTHPALPPSLRRRHGTDARAEARSAAQAPSPALPPTDPIKLYWWKRNNHYRPEVAYAVTG